MSNEELNLEELNIEELDMITLTMDDDTTVECEVLGIFDVEDQEYIAMVPITDAEEEESDVFIYRYAEDEEANPILTNIESDEELEKVFEEFLDIFADEEEEDEE